MIYISTIGCSWLLADDLKKVNQSRWYGVFTTLSPSLLEELGIVQIKNYGGSWISKFFLFSKIISVRILFFWTFWENK